MSFNLKHFLQAKTAVHGCSLPDSKSNWIRRAQFISMLRFDSANNGNSIVSWHTSESWVSVRVRKSVENVWFHTFAISIITVNEFQMVGPISLHNGCLQCLRFVCSCSSGRSLQISSVCWLVFLVGFFLSSTAVAINYLEHVRMISFIGTTVMSTYTWTAQKNVYEIVGLLHVMPMRTLHSTHHVRCRRRDCTNNNTYGPARYTNDQWLMAYTTITDS